MLNDLKLKYSCKIRKMRLGIKHFSCEVLTFLIMGLVFAYYGWFSLVVFASIATREHAQEGARRLQ
jgi:hypothetical protein